MAFFKRGADKAGKTKLFKEHGKEASLSYARTLSCFSFIVVFLTSVCLSFFISNEARQTLMQRQESFGTQLVRNLNNQIFQRFAVPTIMVYGHIKLRVASQYEHLDKVVKSVIEGLPVSRLRMYDFSHTVSYSTNPSDVGKSGLAPAGIEKVLAGMEPKAEVIYKMPLWKALFNLPLPAGTFQLRVLFPLRGDSFQSTDQVPVLGAMELTQDITVDCLQVLFFQAIIVVMCMVSSVVLFALLLLIIHRAEHVLAARVEKNRQLEKELQSTEKLVSMGRVVASIAHEIRNPLGIIRSTSELLQRRAAKMQDKSTSRLLQAIFDESVRLSQTVNDFLDYARPRQPKQDSVQVELVLSQLFAFVEGEFERGGVSLSRTVEGNPWVLGDKDLLYRAFYNVLANARQAMDGAGAVQVSVSKTQESCVLVFQDTGPGFDSEMVGSLLEPFFTTKEQGTGLGLPIVKSIIESHGGTVALSNAPEGGACVTLTLPLDLQAQEKEQQPTP